MSYVFDLRVACKVFEERYFTRKVFKLLKIYFCLRTTPHYIHFHHLLGTSHFALH